MNATIYDFVGIGIGPFNLGLACLTEPLAELKGIFLEQKDQFDWHPGMMLPDAHLQTPFLSDLVTLADPTHRLSFLNYLKKKGRIYSFYIRENFFLLRQEYNQYCQWASSQLSNLSFHTRVESIEWDADKSLYRTRARCTWTGQTLFYLSRKIVLGTGPTPSIPAACAEVLAQTIHSSEYLSNKERIQNCKTITLVGSGQSAAEIYYDLLQDIDQTGYSLRWMTRSPRFFPMEYSKLTLEMTSPEYVDYFFELSESQRTHLLQEQKQLYKGINFSLINAIYDLLYQKRLNNSCDTQLMTHTSFESVTRSDDGLELVFLQVEQGQTFVIPSEILIVATGYSYTPPDFLQGIHSRIRWDAQNRFAVGRNYAIDLLGQEIFVQNVEIHSHGFVTPDLGMACYRNSYIIKEMTGIEHYPIETKTCFQEFSAPKSTANLTIRLRQAQLDSEFFSTNH